MSAPRIVATLLLALAGVVHASGESPYRVTVTAPAPQVDWHASEPAAARSCGAVPPPAPASRSGTVRVLNNIVRDRYFAKFFDDGRLARMITQQKDVPRALVIDSGTWRLPELVRAVNDARVLSGEGVLGLPMLIRPGAAVVIDNGTWLKLDRQRGAFIINLGELQVRDARLSAWDPSTRTSARLRSPSDFRPYVVGWGGSRTVIHHSVIESLGFSEHLSNGLGFARGPFGLKGIDGSKPPEVLVSSNRITDAWTAVRTGGGASRICGNVIQGTHAHGIQVETGSAPVIVVRNQVSGVRGGNALGIEGTSGAWVAANEVNDNAQSGIVVTASRGAWLVNNKAQRNKSDGIRLHDSSAVLVDNLSSGNGDHGVQVRDGADVRIQGLEANNNVGTGIMASRQPRTRVTGDTRWRVVVSGAVLRENRGGAAGMDRPYEMVVGGLSITDSSAQRRTLLRSELNGVEGALLKQVLVEKRYVRVAP